jgi:hypothetical protein
LTRSLPLLSVSIKIAFYSRDSSPEFQSGTRQGDYTFRQNVTSNDVRIDKFPIRSIIGLADAIKWQANNCTIEGFLLTEGQKIELFSIGWWVAIRKPAERSVFV